MAPLIDAHPELNRYLGHGSPANKRLFHPVYGRPAHSGGTQADESDHLKNQVRLVAEKLVAATRAFVGLAEWNHTQSIEEALDRALADGRTAAAAYGVENPIA